MERLSGDADGLSLNEAHRIEHDYLSVRQHGSEATNRARWHARRIHRNVTFELGTDKRLAPSQACCVTPRE
jgi:hypothetical protein